MVMKAMTTTMVMIVMSALTWTMTMLVNAGADDKAIVADNGHSAQPLWQQELSPKK